MPFEGSFDQEARARFATRTVVAFVVRTDEKIIQRDMLINSITSMIGVPLKIKGEIAGAMILENKVGGDSFTEDELEVLTPFPREVQEPLPNRSSMWARAPLLSSTSAATIKGGRC